MRTSKKYRKRPPENTETTFLTILSLVETVIAICVAIFLARTFYIGVLSGNDKLIFGSLLLFIVEVMYLRYRDGCE